MMSRKSIRELSKHLPSQKSRIWLCKGCNRRYARPRRMRRHGRLVVGECWSCKGDLQRVIPPIENGNAFSGPSFVQRMLAEAKKPGPKDWSPRGENGLVRRPS